MYDIKGKLKEAGLTQSDLAGRLGIRNKTISWWVTGRQETPGYAQAYLNLYISVKELLKA